MTKVKKEALTKYLIGLKARLQEKVPSKHQGHPKTFIAFLNREIKVVSDQLDADRLDGAK